MYVFYFSPSLEYMEIFSSELIVTMVTERADFLLDTIFRLKNIYHNKYSLALIVITDEV